MTLWGTLMMSLRRPKRALCPARRAQWEKIGNPPMMPRRELNTTSLGPGRNSGRDQVEGEIILAWEGRWGKQKESSRTTVIVGGLETHESWHRIRVDSRSMELIVGYESSISRT